MNFCFRLNVTHFIHHLWAGKFLKLFLFIPCRVVNEIAWNMESDMFFLTTGNGEKIFLTKLFFFYHQELILIISIFFHSGTIEVLAFPSLKPVDTLMAHTVGCYCIAINHSGRSATILYFLIFCHLNFRWLHFICILFFVFLPANLQRC